MAQRYKLPPGGDVVESRDKVHELMTEATPEIHNPALYVDDRELHRRINPRLGWDRFRAAVRNAEGSGFPRIHKVWGGRYWPKVRAWLDRDAGGENGFVVGESALEDGPEDFNAAPQRRSRTQDRPHS